MKQQNQHLSEEKTPWVTSLRSNQRTKRALENIQRKLGFSSANECLVQLLLHIDQQAQQSDAMTLCDITVSSQLPRSRG